MTTTYTCPECSGTKGAKCHHNTGLDSSKHYWEFVDCDFCNGTGEVSEQRYQLRLAGLQKRKERIARGETLHDVAQRTGRSSAHISREERGLISVNDRGES